MAVPGKPTYIYKIVAYTSPIPDPVPDELPLSELDAQDGFMHFSTARQVPRTLMRYFTNDPSVTIIRINYSKVEHEVKWEDPKGRAPGEVGGENVFPHIYGRSLRSSDLESVVTWPSEGGWDAVLTKAEVEAWLVY